MENMKRVSIPPPSNLSVYGPSALFRFFVEAGDWTFQAFADDIANRHNSKTICTETVVQWANNDVLPKLYKQAFLGIVYDAVEDIYVRDWQQAFQMVWAEQRASKKMRVIISTPFLQENEVVEQHAARGK